MLGWTQQDIGDRQREIYLEGKGSVRRAIADFLAKNGNDHFLPKITDDLSAGHTVEKVARRHGPASRAIEKD